MNQSRIVFSVRRLFATISCLAVACAVPQLGGVFERYREVGPAAKWLPLAACVAVPGAAVGGGIGLLFKQFWAGVVLGVCVGIFLYVSALLFLIRWL